MKGRGIGTARGRATIMRGESSSLLSLTLSGAPATIFRQSETDFSGSVSVFPRFCNTAQSRRGRGGDRPGGPGGKPQGIRR